MLAIKTTGLTKRYQNKTAVNALNLSIPRGELFALLGVNGAGKTTTIKMLSCLTKPTSGDAVVLGESIIMNPHAVKEKINVSPQETAVARNLSVMENLELIAGIYGSDKNNTRIKSNEMISTFGLAEVADDKAKILSGGMQRRLSIAMALISDPQILFLDEPTLGLDVLARRELWSAIKKLKGKITIILTTHYMEEAEALSDRIGIMSNGDLKAVGTAAQLISATGAKNFEDAFVAFATEPEATV
jgi:ABC-2 type transport system ATP-binding protein